MSMEPEIPAERLAVTAANVDAILHGSGGLVGSVGTAGLAGEQTNGLTTLAQAAAPSASDQPARKTRKKRTTSTSAPAPAAADPNAQRTVNILLPPEIYHYFEQQAAKADFEPTLAKYLQWQLRKMYLQQVAAEKAAGVAQEMAAKGYQPGVNVQQQTHDRL